MKKNPIITFASVIIWTLMATPIFASELFTPRVDYGTGSYPEFVTYGDFNGDGKTDLVTANVYSYGISILIGNGDGTFQARRDYSTGWYPRGATTGDFNNDGKLDIAVAVSWQYIVILIGHGDGTFQPTNYYPSDGGPYSVTSGDFNGDGNLDLAATNLYQFTVAVLLGNGDGTFQPARLFAAGWHPHTVVAGDLNNDGKLDLVTANYSNTVSVLIGNGDGTFQTNVEYDTGGSWKWSVIAGDFNADGNLDLATANRTNTISVLLGNGDGTFRSYVDYSAGDGTVSVATGDFNGDGRIDLCTANEYANTISVLIGNGDGTFQPNIDYASGRRPASIITGDFNGDNKIDVATANYYGHSVSIFLNIFNRPPIANAGPDQIVECAGPSGAVVTLEGSGSSDPDGAPLTYTWTWPGGSAEGVSPTVQLPLGITLVTLTVSDGKATAMDTVSIAVGDTTLPVTTATGGNGNWYTTNVISTFTASDSCSGVKEIHYIVNGFATVVPGGYAATTLTNEGVHNISYFAVDNAGNAEAPKTMTVKIDKIPPTLNLSASPNTLWPPDHKMVDVTVGGSASDNLSGVSSVVFNVIDEYGTVQPNISDFNAVIGLEAWREGRDKDGRRYTINAVATDAAGNISTVSAVVLVPHDQR